MGNGNLIHVLLYCLFFIHDIVCTVQICFFIFVIPEEYEDFLSTKISQITVVCVKYILVDNIDLLVKDPWIWLGPGIEWKCRRSLL